MSSPWAGAASVTVIVHGVGDHSPVDICQAAEAGILSAAGAQSGATTKKLAWDGFRSHFPEGQVACGEILEVTWQGQRHCILPFVWSATRQRRTREGVDEPVLRALIAPVSWAAILLAKSFRLCLRAEGWRWRLAAGGAGLALALGVLGVWGAGWLLSGWLIAHFAPLYASVRMAKWGAEPWTLSAAQWSAQALLVIAFLWLASRPLVAAAHVAAMLDLVEDVMDYVVLHHRRESLILDLIGTLQAVAQANPDGRLILVGHSLGSVLVSQVGAGLHAAGLSVPIQILTLGSPLILMSKVFPRLIIPPWRLSRHYASPGCVRFWLHLYRDSDLVGRSLAGGDGSGPVEASLGDGPHWDYWSDARVWRWMVKLLQAGDAEGHRQIAAAALTAAIGPEELGELQQLRRDAASNALLLLPGLLAAAISIRYLLQRDYELVADRMFPALAAGAVLLLLSWAALAISSIPAVRFLSQRNPAALRGLRFHCYVGAGAAWLATTLAVLVLVGCWLLLP